jgi:hypothetical protein
MCALVEPFYPKAGNGRPPIGVERMLRIYFLQQWFNLSDLAAEEACMRRCPCAGLLESIWAKNPCPMKQRSVNSGTYWRNIRLVRNCSKK